jgi:hypothetical protein
LHNSESNELVSQLHSHDKVGRKIHNDVDQSKKICFDSAVFFHRQTFDQALLKKKGRKKENSKKKLVTLNLSLSRRRSFTASIDCSTNSCPAVPLQQIALSNFGTI